MAGELLNPMSADGAAAAPRAGGRAGADAAAARAGRRAPSTRHAAAAAGLLIDALALAAVAAAGLAVGETVCH